MIKPKEKAQFLLKLSALEDAGLPLMQAIEAQLPLANKALNQMMVALLADLKAGRPLGVAGLKSGLLSEVDGWLIKAATDAGKLATALKQLAAHYEMKHQLTRRIKSRLLLPVLLFALAVFMAPIPRLVSGAIDITTYFNLTVLLLLKLSIALLLLIKTPAWLRSGRPPSFGLAGVVDRCLLTLPIMGAYYLKHHITRFFETLGMLLQAGIPAFEAVPKSVSVIDNNTLKGSFKPVVLKLQSGTTLTDALAVNQYIPAESIQHIQAGEQSGRLDEALVHYAGRARAEVNDNLEQIALWVPRIIYAVIAIAMAHAIFAAHETV